MKTLFFPALLLLIAVFSVRTFAENGNTRSRIIAFYNVENFFDTINDPTHADGAFTPTGRYEWGSERYFEKIRNISRVASRIGADFIGLAEVENERVLTDLIRSPDLADLHYDFLFVPSGDYRGMNVAFLYRPYRFRPLSFRSIAPSVSGTRDILHIHGRWEERHIHVLVCHLPSMTSSPAYRKAACRFLGSVIDSLCRVDPESVVVTMGDFNGNPGSGPVARLARDSRRPGHITQNGFRQLHRKGYGSYKYGNKWNMLDMILVTRPRTDRSFPEPEAHVFIRDPLIQTEGRFSGYPFRTYSGTDYIGGYSDHLPVYLRFNFEKGE